MCACTGRGEYPQKLRDAAHPVELLYYQSSKPARLREELYGPIPTSSSPSSPTSDCTDPLLEGGRIGGSNFYGARVAKRAPSVIFLVAKLTRGGVWAHDHDEADQIARLGL